MKTQKILSTASLLAGTFICANLAGYGNSAYAATSSGKSYSQSMTDFERGLEVRRGNAQGGTRRSEIQKRREDSFSLLVVEDDVRRSLSVKAFYAAALEAPTDWLDDNYSSPEVDLVGLTVEYEQDFYSNLYGGPRLSWLGALSLGSGSKDYEHLGELTIATLEATFGFNLRWDLGSHVSLFVGPRLGLNFLYADVDYDAHSEHDKDDSGMGLIGGLDSGVDINFNDHSGMLFGIGCLASTAKPLGMAAQSWIRFSVGYKYTF